VQAAATPGLAVDDRAVAEWLGAELGALTDFFGRAPSDELAVFVAPGTAEVTRGETLTGGGSSVLIRLGTKVHVPSDLRDDWVAAHELIHVTVPSTDYEHQWFSEGLACYAEPLARVRAGLLTEEKMWADLEEGLPRGLPKSGDTGLDGARDIGRVYWGGTLFFLMADLEIRERSGGNQSLRDGLRHLASRGANGEARWPIERLLATIDEGTGSHVLEELYGRQGRKSEPVDLAALWKRLAPLRAKGTFAGARN
jgi:predicted metalloprotease with PDZ domain